MKKRVGIFCFYDSAGIVDPYVIYFLKSLEPHLKELIIVCNGKVTELSTENLKQFTKHILIRENHGFDTMAYKAGLDYLEEYLDMDSFDEILLFNDTVFGPIYPFSEVFEKMDEQLDLDFWGMTRYHGHKGRKEHYSEHIQSYWTVIRRKMFQSNAFREYWENVKSPSSYQEAIEGHEVVFTKYFENLGYLWDVYSDISSEENSFISYPLFFMPLELIKKTRCPIIKRRMFTSDYKTTSAHSSGRQVYEVFQFLKENTDYNTNLILENILRIGHLEDIKNNLNFNFILSNKTRDTIKLGKKEVGLILYICHEDQIMRCFHYAKSMPEGSSFLIVTDTDEKKCEIERVFLSTQSFYSIDCIVLRERSEGIVRVLLEAKFFIEKNDILCVVHDHQIDNVLPETIREDLVDRCFKGILSNDVYVDNILAIFKENPKLGIAFPPPPNHVSYLSMLGDEWGVYFDATKKVVESLQLNIPLSYEKDPVAPFSSMFWFRKEILKPLFNYDWKETKKVQENNILPCVEERIFSFLSQDQGYYPAWIFPTDLAENEITNLHYFLQSINKETRKIWKIKNLNNLVKNLRKIGESKLQRFYWKNLYQKYFGK